MQDKKLRKRLISSIFSLFATFVALVGASFAWLSNNKKVSSGSMSVEVATNIQMKFEDDVTAVRHCLSGEVITNTYEKQSNKQLKLVSSASTDPSYESPTTGSSFLFDEMLPGEYVDITISFSALEEFNADYVISLGSFDFTYGTFTINSVTYNVLGAFKYKPISIGYYDEGDNERLSVDYSTEEYEWLSNYTVGTNSEVPNDIPIYEGEWSSTYKKGTLTFRVYEDFTQYYRLINAIGESIPNQLSEKILKVGQIRIAKKGS